MAAQLQSWIDENQALVIRRPTPADADGVRKNRLRRFRNPCEQVQFPSRLTSA
jgi:hypothetical protein